MSYNFKGLADLNYFYFYLLNYLQENRFQVETDHPQIVANASAALDIFEEARRNDSDITQAEESGANRTLICLLLLLNCVGSFMTTQRMTVNLYSIWTR
ncbi:MAG: DUF1896 domain-containing protein [Bacteroides sp.]|nr:DUF1896 domain-containing protein [Bacteroides sp.]